MSSPMPGSDDSQNSSTTKQRMRACFNFPYIVTSLFVLKVINMLILIAGAISVSIQYSQWGESRYYNFVAVTGIAVAFLSIMANFTYLVTKTPRFPWNLCEIIFNCLWAILILIAAAIVTDKARRFADMNTYAAGAFFAYASFLLYLLDALIRIIKLKRGEQGFTIRAQANTQSTYDASKNNSQPTY